MGAFLKFLNPKTNFNICSPFYLHEIRIMLINIPSYIELETDKSKIFISFFPSSLFLKETLKLLLLIIEKLFINLLDILTMNTTIFFHKKIRYK